MHRRVGPVFGDRYRSEGIEDDAYLLGALRYIHLNKVSVLGLLGGNVRGFTEFHRQSDLTLYLEASEDRESYRLAVAHQGLERFRLTLRKAAEVLETSHTKVYQALQDD